jgi:hypothetical protein
MAPIAIPIRTDAEIEAAITMLGQQQAGLIVVQFDSSMNVHHTAIIAELLRQKVRRSAAGAYSDWPGIQGARVSSSHRRHPSREHGEDASDR